MATINNAFSTVDDLGMMPVGVLGHELDNSSVGEVVLHHRRYLTFSLRWPSAFVRSSSQPPRMKQLIYDTPDPSFSNAECPP